MTRGLSLYLDLVRFGAALAVVMTHLAYPDLSGGMLLPWRQAGNDAVMVFFVLSGFVIAHVAHEKEHDVRAYAVSRLARLWSVAVPALLITLLLDQAGRMLDPAAYAAWWYQASDPLGRMLRALSFTNEIWFSSIRPFSNGPWWSLGYEALYYAIFAAISYFRGAKRWFLAGGLMLLAGPKILLLLPIWWLGVWTWQRCRQGAVAPRAALILFGGSVLAYALLRWSGVPVVLKQATALVIGPENVVPYLHFSDEFVASYLIGPLVAMHFLGAHGLSAALEARLGAWRRPIAWFAQSTFALYLLHYPMLRFAHAALGYDINSPWQVAAIFGGVVGTCVLVGPLIERTKDGWKALIARMLGGGVPVSRPVPSPAAPG